MKNMIALLALVLTAGSVSCTSAPKKEEVSQTPVVATETLTEEMAQTTEPAMPVEDTLSSTTTPSDLSLGAGSSGRGH